MSNIVVIGAGQAGASLVGEMATERVYLHPECFNAEQGITLHFGSAVTGIDRAARGVLLNDDRLPYVTDKSTQQPAFLEKLSKHRGDELSRFMPDVSRVLPASTKTITRRYSPPAAHSSR